MKSFLWLLLGMGVTGIAQGVGMMLSTLIVVPLLLLIVTPIAKYRATIHAAQFIAYALADLGSMFAGALILRKVGETSNILWIIFPITTITIFYVFKSFRFDTDEAKKLNQWQKAMAVLGTLAAAALFTAIVWEW